MKKLMIAMLMVGAMGQVEAMGMNSMTKAAAKELADDISQLNQDIFNLGTGYEKGVTGLFNILSQAEKIQKSITGQAQKMFGLMEMQFEKAKSVQHLNNLTANALNAIAKNMTTVASLLSKQ